MTDKSTPPVPGSSGPAGDLPDAPRPRWFDHRNPEERLDYAYRFIRIAEDGVDIDGEARFIDAMAGRGATVLDAGCGTGRVAAALTRSGHQAAGVDADPTLIDKGREFYPGLPLTTLDLWHLTAENLAANGLPTAYDVIVCAGNVMLFVAEDTEHRVLDRLAGVLKPGGRAVFGFFTGRDYTHNDLDRDAAAVGWLREHRFGTWQFDPFVPATETASGSDWAVSVYRAP